MILCTQMCNSYSLPEERMADHGRLARYTPPSASCSALNTLISVSFKSVLILSEDVYSTCSWTVFSSGFAEAIPSPAPSTVNANVLSDNISISVVDDNEYSDNYVGRAFLSSRTCSQSKLLRRRTMKCRHSMIRINQIQSRKGPTEGTLTRQRSPTKH